MFVIYDHLLDECPKATPKRVVYGVDKGKGPVTGATKEVLNGGFTTVKRKGPIYKQVFGVSKTKKMEYRSIVPKNTKDSPPKDYIKERLRLNNQIRMLKWLICLMLLISW